VISPIAVPISFRIEDNWRAFAGCKLVFGEAVEARKPMALRDALLNRPFSITQEFALWFVLVIG
jgi:hypothetical protein